MAAAALAIAALAVRAGLRARDWRDDETLFASAVRAEPWNAEARTNHGLALSERGNTEAARREWEEAVRLDPTNPAALVQLGIDAAERGRLDRAEEWFVKALRAQPGEAEARFNLALLFDRTRRPAQAIVAYEQFLRVATGEHSALVPRVRERLRRLREGLGRAPEQ